MTNLAQTQRKAEKAILDEENRKVKEQQEADILAEFERKNKNHSVKSSSSIHKIDKPNRNNSKDLADIMPSFANTSMDST
jgi:hypothetical protein